MSVRGSGFTELALGGRRSFFNTGRVAKIWAKMEAGKSLLCSHNLACHTLFPMNDVAEVD